MFCPFLGMDPRLESPHVWPDVHDALATEIRSALNGSLPKPYYAQLGTREELEVAVESIVRRIVPDVDYSQPPDSPLPDDLREWAAELLAR